MIDQKLMAALLDSLKESLLFADTDHTIRYMNKAAIARYKRGESLIGTSLLDCHNENSQRIMIDILAAMHEGEDERFIGEFKGQRLYMRAVRDEDGKLVGYYERYEPPAAK